MKLDNKSLFTGTLFAGMAIAILFFIAPILFMLGELLEIKKTYENILSWYKDLIQEKKQKQYNKWIDDLETRLTRN